MTRKEEIIQTALALFAEEGYEHIGVQRIVEAVGVTKPTLYHHFGNKEGLLSDIMAVYMTPFLDNLKSVSCYHQDVMGATEQIIGAYISFAKKTPKCFWLLNHLRKAPAKSPSKAIVTLYLSDERALLHDFFEAVGQHHTGIKGQAQFLTTALMGLIVSFIETHMDQGTLNGVHEGDIHKLAQQFLYGIFSI